MLRESVAPTRSSHASNSSAQAKFLEKKKEYEAVAQLDKLTALMADRMEGLGEDCDIMALAGEVHGEVLNQWPKMFQILSLFLASRDEDGSDDAPNRGQQLVRVPVDELKQEEATD